MKNLIRIAILLASSLAWAGPTITAIAVTATTPTTATIIWTTGTPASSQVLYGIGNTGSSTPVDGTLLTSHSVTVALLNAGPIYTYAVVSQDSTGSTTSATNTFALCGGRSNTAVTGTINTAYEYGLYTATLVNDSGSGATPTVCGSAVTSPVSGTLAWNGVLTQPLPDNNLIVPSPSHWSFTVTSMTGTGGPIGSFTITRVITGNSQDISATLQAGATGQLQHVFYDPATLVFNPPISGGGGGTVTSITAGTGITATPNPIIGAGTIGIANTAVTPASYTNTNLTVNAQGQITAASNGSAGAGTVTTTGSPASPNLAGFSGPTAITNVNLSGDVITTNTPATTLAAIQGLPVTLTAPALGQTLSINGTPALVNGYPGIPVDARSSATPTITGDGVGSDRASLVNTTNNSVSTAVTVPLSGSVGFGSSFPFLHCNSGTVIATDTATVNGNASVVLQAKPAGGNPQCVGWYGTNAAWIAWETLPTDANGQLPTNSIAGITGVQGNGAKLQLSTGTVTQNFLAKFDANGNTINSGLQESGFVVNSNSLTQGVTYGGGGGGVGVLAITVGGATINGGNVVSGTAASVAGASFLNGGSNAAANTASQAGATEVMPGASTNTTQGLQGLNIFGSPYVRGTTVTQWNLQCESAANTVADCPAFANNWAGVAEVVGANTVSVLTGSQVFINASAAVTLGDTLCIGATASKATDSGGKLSCTSAQGAQYGVVMATSGTWTLPDGTTVTATTTLPLVQVNPAYQPVAETAHIISGILACEAASASGTAYTCTTSPSFVPADLDMVLFEADVANTGAATLVVNGQAGTPAIRKQGGGTAIVANDILAGQWVFLVFDGTNWQMQGQLGNAPSGSGTVNTGTANHFAYYATSTNAVSDAGTNLQETATGVSVTGQGTTGTAFSAASAAIGQVAGTFNNFTGTNVDIADFQINGANKVTIDSSGNLHIPASGSLSALTAAGAVTVQSGQDNATTATAALFVRGNDHNSTGGTSEQAGLVTVRGGDNISTASAATVMGGDATLTPGVLSNASPGALAVEGALHVDVAYKGAGTIGHLGCPSATAHTIVNCASVAANQTYVGIIQRTVGGSQGVQVLGDISAVFDATITATPGDIVCVSTISAHLVFDSVAVGCPNVQSYVGRVKYQVTAATAAAVVTMDHNPQIIQPNTTSSNCSSGASPAVCAAAPAGSVAVPTGTNPTLTVNTTAVTANSQIFLQSDSTLGTKLSVTCNTTLASLATEPVVTTRTAATSFVITINGVISTNPVCLSYYIIN